MAILGKKQMSEEDIKLNYITPVIQRGRASNDAYQLQQTLENAY